MKFNFYDIESLRNVFTLANYIPDETDPKHDHIDLYMLCDTPSLLTSPTFYSDVLSRIYQKNKNFCGTFRIWDLHEKFANDHMAKTFGLTCARYINNPDEEDAQFHGLYRLVCDTDPDYDENIHPYLAGYNSYNYDTTMLSLYFNEIYLTYRDIDSHKKSMEFSPTSADMMRNLNNALFSKQFKDNMPQFLSTGAYGEPDFNDPRYIVRKNMLMSGRHIDVARLNEKQSKVALKRLLGMLGYQILESDKLKTGQDTVENADQLYDLIAYNISDVVNLRKLFEHPLYQANFTLKKQLLHTYPELIYKQRKDSYKPDISPKTVRNDRLFIDSSSAQIATKCLCPYGHLDDMPYVSFLYPSEAKAKQFGIKRRDILEESKEFFYNMYPQEELRRQFDVIYNYYDAIRGKNFNDSKNYKEKYQRYENDPTGTIANPAKLASLSKGDTCLPYFDKNGKPTSCFVTFSTGGIHGAELNAGRYESHMSAFQKECDALNQAKEIFPNPVDLRKAKTVMFPDGSMHEYKEFLQSGLRIDASQYKNPEKNRPQLFVIDKDGQAKLHPKYVYTSADASNHEDFTSYYPNLLIMMDAFYNEGLGYDRYEEIFGLKQTYGKQMKDKAFPKEERDMFKILREGTKLILNSASGAGDTNFESNIRMNNTIISMRIIGQLFSWRIGQAQAYAGAKMISTNTDGLYSVMEKTVNDQILEREAKSIHVEIEPEPLFLISKDTNNRIEYDPETDTILGASGGTLACRKGPDPAKALAHPAIIDWAMTRYLIDVAGHKNGLTLESEFDDNLGRKILLDSVNHFEGVKLLTMFQNILASSIGSVSYNYASDTEHPDEIRALPHYNRVFLMQDGTPGCCHMQAAVAKVITDAMKTKRRRDPDSKPVVHEYDAAKILRLNGVELPDDKDVVTKKITGIERNWYIYICNKDLNYLTQEEFTFIYQNLSIPLYLGLFRDCYENNWRNHMD